MSIQHAVLSVSGVFAIPCLFGWLLSQAVHRAKVNAFRSGREYAEQKCADMLPEASVKLREDMAFNDGYFLGLKNKTGVALRAANGRFTTREALFT